MQKYRDGGDDSDEDEAEGDASENGDEDEAEGDGQDPIQPPGDNPMTLEFVVKVGWCTEVKIRSRGKKYYRGALPDGYIYVRGGIIVAQRHYV